ncbi:MAG: cyclic nucleotide-binding domain-containing protein [Patescibacteria group bacterium]
MNGDSIAQLSAGDIFGEIALLNEEQRTASVYSQGETEVIVLKIDDIMQMLSSDNQINKTIINRIEENISRN